MAAGIPSDVIAGSHCGLALAHEARFGCRAAHVEGDDIGRTQRGADPRRGDDAAHRPGFHHGRGTLRGDFRRHDAAARAHDGESAAKPELAKLRDQPLHVAADLGPDIRIDHGRRHALELPIFAQDLVRQRYVCVRQGRAHDLASAALVLGIGVGVQKAHRDRLYPFGREGAARRGNAGRIEWHMDFARAEQALIDLAREMARHQRPEAMKEEVVGFRAVAAPDDVDVTGAAGDNQAGLGALALDQRIDRDGRAMDQLVHGRGSKSALVDAVDDSLRELRGRGEALGLHELLAGIIEADEIGEGAPDIDRNHNHAGTSLWRSCTRMCRQ